MVTQKMISLKLDIDQLNKLDDLCITLNCNRNKLINFFVSQGVELLSEYKKCLLVSAYSSALSEFRV